MSTVMIAKGGIAINGRLQTHLKDREEGSFDFTFPVTYNVSPFAQVVIYAILPSGEIIADSNNFKVKKCFKNKVELRFSSPRELPGGDTNLHLQAKPGSLCSVRSVDKSVLLMDSSHELTADVIVPDTITEWQADAFCTSPEGFGLAHPIGLTAFQPFFVELTLPYSVVRGEAFQLKASVFNYLSQCIVVKVSPAESSQYNLEPCEGCEYKSCVCADESKVFRWTFTAKALGEVNVTVRAEALNTEELCGNEVVAFPDHGRADTVIRKLLVEAEGVQKTTAINALLCPKDKHTESNTFSLELPEVFVEGSAKASVSVLGDVIGRAMQNLDKLLAMPFGCGEQNMLLFAPNIYILRYLEATGQMTEQIKAKAIRFMESGYQRELNYKHTDGSYSAFGNSDESGNTWLTAFVMKSFGSARRFIFIDPAHISDAKKWLGKHQQENGCFRNVGKLFHSGMKGGINDEISLTAYITTALLELETPLSLALEYNVPPPPNFSIFNITAEAEGQCNSSEKNILHLKIVVGYNGNRDRTNMVIVNVKLLSGYQVDKVSISKLRRNPLVKRIDKDKGYIDIYLEESEKVIKNQKKGKGQKSKFSSLALHQTLTLMYSNATAIGDDHAEAEYRFPCTRVEVFAPYISTAQTSHLTYMVAIPHQIHGGTMEKVCAHLLQPNETILITITLTMESANLTLLEEKIKEKDFYKCIEFKVPMSNKFVGHIEMSLKGESFEVVDKKKVLITPSKPMTFIQTDKPIYKPGQTGNSKGKHSIEWKTSGSSERQRR
ncbi:A2MG protein, partial [Polypterus senegalus]|nr:A2MG protein [Polypterus senegalus]